MKLQELITRISQEATGVDALRRKVVELGTKVADAGLKAEQTRNEILDHVKEIRAMEDELATIRVDQRRFTLVAAGLAILGNMVVLFVLVRWLVENPLRRMIATIDNIRAG